MKPVTVRIDANVYVLWACILFVMFIVIAVRGLDLRIGDQITVTEIHNSDVSEIDHLISPVALAIE